MADVVEIAKLEEALCDALCARVRVVEDLDKRLLVSTPFRFPDGDEYQMYIEPEGPNAFRVTDSAHTLMHMSYDFDVDALKDGRRKALLDSVLYQHDVLFEDGEMFKIVPKGDLAAGILSLGQAITQVFAITAHSRDHIATTFYEDLRQELYDLIDAERITHDYAVRDIPNADDYPIDYRIETEKGRDLFLFGVPGRDKAQVTTIVLMYLLSHGVSFDSLIVLNSQYSDYGSAIFRRLMNYADAMVTLDNHEALSRKIAHRTP